MEVTRSMSAPARGPLRVHPNNPRYLADGSGRAVYLTGSHTWNNLQDIGPQDPPPAFDFTAYLDFLQRYHHNIIRLWRWELLHWDTSANGSHAVHAAVHTAAPHPWARTGPGEASDGKPKFNLEQFDPSYFERLRARVTAARDRGIFASIMLFEGWGLQFVAHGWKAHPFHPDNHVNSLRGGPDRESKGLAFHTLASPAVTALQEAYVRKVIETVNDLDNVLYEISNENHPGSTEWQYHMIRTIRETEKRKHWQHPVGMTFQHEGGSNAALFDSPADWISPNSEGGYSNDPPPADGRKVILSDTDHLWGIGGNRPWVWKSFLRGHHPLFMDPYDGLILGKRFDPQWDPIRRSLGDTLRFAERLDLAAMKPCPELASTGYCLATPGREYLVYQPQPGKPLTVNAEAGPYRFEWFNPQTAAAAGNGRLSNTGGRQELTAPFEGDAVLHLQAASRDEGA